ncbi:MAG: glyoxalase superfamily protein [Pseudomonadota bacterium]|nr:glyoxalase superfamily protein [Pseudomonadota bacterium]
MIIRSIADAKKRAAHLRETAAENGQVLSHGRALETVASEQGARDWNTLRARLANRETIADNLDIADLRTGMKVEGRYMNQPFVGRIVDTISEGEGRRIAIHLDRPVDVVTFTSFSNMRRRIRGTIENDRRSKERTSDGNPHLMITAITG